MELPGDRRLNGILVGALADAMYGCDRYMVKAKYGKGCSLAGLVGGLPGCRNYTGQVGHSMLRTVL